MINVVIFKNAKILKQDCNLENVWWLYQELYKVDDKYEVHILLRDEKKLYDLILTCDDIVLEK